MIRRNEVLSPVFALLAVSVAATLLAADPNALTDDEKRDGFEAIFNGRDLAGWKHNGNWVVEDGVITRSARAAASPTRSKKCPTISSSASSGRWPRGATAACTTAPGQYEYQILDNQTHADGKNPRTSAASLYFCMAPSHDATKPVGQWNTGRIVCKGTRDPALAQRPEGDRLRLQRSESTRPRRSSCCCCAAAIWPHAARI